MKKLALVLGGGAAKGYAHIGVLKILEKNGIVPDLIVGTSMGALVGGLFAMGKTTAELEELASNFNSLGNFSLYSTLFKGNILNVSRVQKIIEKETKGRSHDDLKIPFVSVSTEINTGKEVQFSKGLLKDSIMSSISIPGVFPTYKVGENKYFDGGMVNNLPEDIARQILPDAYILSVDVIGDYSKQVERLKFKTIENILNASTIMITNVIKRRKQDADLRLTIPLPHVSQLDFSYDMCKRTIKKGEDIMKKNITILKTALRGE